MTKGKVRWHGTTGTVGAAPPFSMPLSVLCRYCPEGPPELQQSRLIETARLGAARGIACRRLCRPAAPKPLSWRFSIDLADMGFMATIG